MSGFELPIIAAGGTAKFAVMMAVVVGGLLAGYGLRKSGLLRPDASRPITFWLMVAVYPAIGVLSVWALPLKSGLVWVMVQPVLLDGIIFLFGLGVGRLLGLDFATRGLFANAAAHGNYGFTLGGFLCLRLFGEEGLAVATVYILLWTVVVFSFYFPLARIFADPTRRMSLRAMLGGIFDLRCLTLLGILVGLALNAVGEPRPAFVTRTHLLDVLVAGTTGLMFMVVGLQLFLGDMLRYWRLHASLVGIKLLVCPAVSWGLIVAGRRLPLEIDALHEKVMMLESCMPMALFVVVMANLYGLRPRLASLLLFANTAIFLLVGLPGLMLVFGWLEG